MKHSTPTIAFALSACLATASASAAGLVNGSFELPVLNQSILTYGQTPDDFGWKLAAGDIDAVRSDYWQTPSGTQSIDLNGTTAGSIYQDFRFSSVGVWAVKFELSANPDLFAGGDGLGSGLKSMRAEFGIPGSMTNLGTFALDASPRTIANMDWVTFTTPLVEITNASVLYRLQFTSLSEGIGGPGLDNVRLHRSGPCPDPTIRVSEVECCWESEAQRLYQVQYRSSLTTNHWVVLLSTNVPGTGATICIPDRVPAGHPQRFYRVVCAEE